MLWPWFVAMLPAAGVVFALDGVLIGAGDVGFLRTITVVAAVFAFAPLNVAALYWHWGLGGVWAGPGRVHRGAPGRHGRRVPAATAGSSRAAWPEPLSIVTGARPDRDPRPPAQDGLVVVDKPAGWTSHDVVGRLRRLARTRKVGHAGTLDPMATGVLVVGVGAATRLLHHLVLADKAYTATIRLGAGHRHRRRRGRARPAGRRPPAVTEDAVRARDDRRSPATILQVPSAVSAIKVDGQRSYKRVRDGEAVELPARPVTVSRFAAIGVRAARRRTCSTSTSRSSAPRAPTCARSPATWAPRSASAATSPPCGAPGSARSRSTGRAPSTTLAELDDPVTLPLADAVRHGDAGARRRRRRGARAVLRPGARRRAASTGVHGALAPDGTAVALLAETDGRARPVLVFAAAG